MVEHVNRSARDGRSTRRAARARRVARGGLRRYCSGCAQRQSTSPGQLTGGEALPRSGGRPL